MSDTQSSDEEEGTRACGTVVGAIDIESEEEEGMIGRRNDHKSMVSRLLGKLDALAIEDAQDMVKK